MLNLKGILCGSLSRVDSGQVSNIYSEVLCPRVELPVARCPKEDVL